MRWVTPEPGWAADPSINHVLSPHDQRCISNAAIQAHLGNEAAAENWRGESGYNGLDR